MRRLVPLLIFTGVFAQFALSRWAQSLPLALFWLCAFSLAILAISILEPRPFISQGAPVQKPSQRFIHGLFVILPIAPIGLSLVANEDLPEVGLSYFAYDDYSNWLANLSQIEAGRYEPRFGGIFNLFLLLSLGVARLFHLGLGFSLTGFGVVVLALTITLLLLGLLAGTTTARLHKVLLAAGMKSIYATIICFATLAILTWFLKDVFRLGHLTAALVVLIVLHETISLRPTSNTRDVQWHLLIVVLATSLWFPLLTLTAVGSSLLLWSMMKSRSTDGVRGLFRPLVGASIMFFPLIDGAKVPLEVGKGLVRTIFVNSPDIPRGNLNRLFELSGGTVTLHTTFLLVTALLVPLGLSITGFKDPRNMVSGAAICFAVVVRCYDFMPDGSLGYGSNKLLWMAVILSMVLSGLIVAEYFFLRLQFENQEILRTAILTGLLLLALIPSGLGLVSKFWTYTPTDDASRIEDQTDRSWLSPGVFESSRSLESMPKVCFVVLNSDLDEKIVGSFEGYPCTRILSGLGYASEPYAAEAEMGRYAIGMALRGGALSEVAKHAIDKSNWLREVVLLLEPTGEVVREERLVDVLAQEFLTKSMTVEWVSTIPKALNCQPAPVSIDSRRGGLVGWASTEVEALVVVDVDPALDMSLTLTRVVRDDVASLLGAHERRAGFRSGAMEISTSAPIFARMRDGEFRPIGEVQGCVSPSEVGEAS